MSQTAQPIDPPAPSSSTGVPEIHAHEAHRKYSLIDLDDTAMERTTAELFQGSKLLHNYDLWKANFRVTIERVRGWCEQFRSQVRLALVDVRSNKVLFYFVPTSSRYDLGLGDAMTDLEVELGGSAGIGYVETLQVPDRSLDRFVGPRSNLVWHDGTAAESE